jgi:hypothetical protein
MKSYQFLKVYRSPFLRPKIRWYFGRVRVGVPYSLPRKWLGLDFVGLGWKTKWGDDDFRFQWNPLVSFVFWKWQVALSWVPDHADYYWEAWLYWELRTQKSQPWGHRVQQCRAEFPMITATYNGAEETVIDWYDSVLRPKYRKYFIEY